MTERIDKDKLDKMSGLLGKVPISGGKESEDGVSKTRETLKAQKKYKIMIPSTEKDSSPVFLGVNGWTFLVKRDEVVELPESVKELLDNAKMTVYVQRKADDGGEGLVLVPMEVLRYPYQLLA